MQVYITGKQKVWYSCDGNFNRWLENGLHDHKLRILYIHWIKWNRSNPYNIDTVLTSHFKISVKGPGYIIISFLTEFYSQSVIVEPRLHRYCHQFQSACALEKNTVSLQQKYWKLWKRYIFLPVTSLYMYDVILGSWRVELKVVSACSSHQDAR